MTKWAAVLVRRLLVAAVLMTPQTALAQGHPKVPPGHESLVPGRIEAHRAVWRLVDSDGTEQGLAIRDVERVMHLEGEPAITVFVHMRLPNRSALDISYLHARTLLPFARYLTSRNGFWVHFQSEDKLVASFTRRAGGEPISIQTPFEHGRFNGGVVDLVLAAQPLVAGYQAELPLLGASGQADDLTQTMQILVTDRHAMDMPDGANVDAWRVELRRNRGSDQVMYISTQPPYLILREVLNEAGDVVQRWELTEWARN